MAFICITVKNGILATTRRRASPRRERGKKTERGKNKGKKQTIPTEHGKGRTTTFRIKRRDTSRSDLSPRQSVKENTRRYSRKAQSRSSTPIGGGMEAQLGCKKTEREKSLWGREFDQKVT